VFLVHEGKSTARRANAPSGGDYRSPRLGC
jgi:hypothetical protein